MAAGPDLKGIEVVFGFALFGAAALAAGSVYGVIYLFDHLRWYWVP